RSNSSQMISTVPIVQNVSTRSRRRNLISLSLLLAGQRQQGAAHEGLAQVHLIAVHFERLRELESCLGGFSRPCVADWFVPQKIFSLSASVRGGGNAAQNYSHVVPDAVLNHRAHRRAGDGEVPGFS